MARRGSDPWKKKTRGGFKILNTMIKGTVAASGVAAKVLEHESKRNTSNAAYVREKEYNNWKNGFYSLYDNGRFEEAAECYKIKFPYHLEQDVHFNYSKLRQIDREKPVIIIISLVLIILLIWGAVSLINFIF